MDDQRPSASPHQIGAPLQVPLAPSADAPARARSELTAWLEQDAAPATLIHDAQLLVSELVTNCVRHADISQKQPLRLTGSLRGVTSSAVVATGQPRSNAEASRPAASRPASASTASATDGLARSRCAIAAAT